MKALRRILPDVQSRFYSVGQKEQKFYPEAPAPIPSEIQFLRDFIDSKSKIVVISGAGLSTESGIPDYRSKDVGMYDRVNHKPMQHNDFIRSDAFRKKYWARNYLGWDTFSKFLPNNGHKKLSELEESGKVLWHVSQNVDGLCHKAGSKNLTELHGSMHRVLCLNCKSKSPRSELQQRFREINAGWSAPIMGYGPDSDVYIKDEHVSNFKVPKCVKCNGVLKPDVIFFGDTVPSQIVKFVFSQIDSCDGLLVVGSSLHVWSGFRFVSHAAKKSIPCVAINVGPTRADHLLHLKVNALCSNVLKSV